MLLSAFLLVALPVPQEEGEVAASPTVDAQQDTAERALTESLEAYLGSKKASGLKAYTSKDQRLLFWSDFKSSQTKKAIKWAGEILEAFDDVLGVPEDLEGAALRAVFIRKEDNFNALCDALIAADPRQTEFFESSRESTGLTLYRPPFTVYFHDGKVQDEARADSSIAHNLVHLELVRRYGELPMWLREGLACAGEDIAFGEVWSNWYRDGFVYAKSHQAWRAQAAKRMMLMGHKLNQLFDYPARPFEEDYAELAFGFSVWGMEAKPKELHAFLNALHADYQKHWKAGGRYEPSPETVADLASECFGATWQADLRAFWADPKAQKRKKR